MLIAVAGCVAQAEGAEIRRRQSAVDLVVGPQSYHRLPEMIAKAVGRAGERLAADFEADAKFDALPVARRVTGVSAFLTIQEGCDRFCTFCVVPYTRGAEFSRPAADVEAEARRLVEGGAREITLLGQNVNAYHGCEGGLAGLVRRLARIPGLKRIRYTTSHPANLDEALILAHAEVPELMPYLHLPVQSGSDRMLKAMNRTHDRDAYLRLVERLRAARPDIALSSDFIVGFPGETDEDFDATLDLVREVRFASAFSFKYSRRPGTPAAAMTRQVSEEVKAERLASLNAVLESAAARLQRQTGRPHPAGVGRKGRPPPRPDRRPQSLPAGCPLRGIPRHDRPRGSGGDRLRRAHEPGRRPGAGGGLSRGVSEFIALSEDAVRAVSGAGGRHAALIETAFHVLMETPGGGVSLNGDAAGRRAARRAIESLSERVASHLEVTTADVRVAIDQARSGDAPAPSAARRNGFAASARNAAQATYLDALASRDLVFGLGPAGTGKTFLAVAHGASLLRAGAIERLVVTRPAVEAGERLGFLPGDLTEKVDPYMAPVWEALTTILGAEALRRRRERGEIEVAPIAFMRGRTLSHAFVIVDEAQNTSRMQMKMVLTRIGEGSRMAVTGDPTQIDLINPNDSGLAHAVSILEGVEGVAVTRFSAADVVRHPLVGRIVAAYDADVSRRNP